MNGGLTDCYKPYRRTEAGEMARWFRDKITSVGSDARLSTEALAKVDKGVMRWQIVSCPSSLSSVENLLNFKPFVHSGSDIIIFCEKTRTSRIRKLAKQISAQRKFTIVPIEFDGSPRRYQPIRNKQSERDFLRMELAALKNKKDLEKLRAFMKEKLRLMRHYSAAEAHRRLPEILEKLHEKHRS